jgi:ribosomal protein S18 acetylase RimI-like enzyme/sugar phosphate isomerase/epimerase
MGLKLDILEISRSNSAKLTSFIKTLNEEQKAFRYFKNRSLEVLKNHVFTCLLMYNSEAVGYGHLDTEDNVVWLGIVIRKEFQGKGLAKEIMRVLINKAHEKSIESIHLSVDNDNERAIKLYKSFGFEVLRKKDFYSILRKRVSNVSKNTAMNLGISTLAFAKKTREEIVALAKENDWTIEFSSSFPYFEDMIQFFNNTDIKRLAHNYFPAPKVPFVINLASTDEKIRQTSINHCIQGLQITKNCGAPYFSAHAGFCVDPDPNQLGKQLDINVAIDRSLNWTRFKDSVQIILLEAKRLDLIFLIENNVTAKFNLRNDGQEVLFCSRSEEMAKLVKEISSERFGLLLDTAHLKISSQALGFNAEEAVEKIKPYVKYIHHSDNDGKSDTNESISSDYWFLPFMNQFKDCTHILEVKNITINQIKQQLSLMDSYGL